MIPPRVDVLEYLDTPDIEPQALAENLRDLAYTDRLLGSTALVWRRVLPLLRVAGPTPTLLDVATGGGHGARWLAARARRAGFALQTIASDRLLPALMIAADARGSGQLLCHDAMQVPFADSTIDIVTCALALHHFAPARAAAVLCALTRVARVGVVVVDLRRSWLAIAGADLLAHGPWGSYARHDGPVSARRAYTVTELRTIVRAAGISAEVHGAEPLLWSMVVRLV